MTDLSTRLQQILDDRNHRETIANSPIANFPNDRVSFGNSSGRSFTKTMSKPSIAAKVSFWSQFLGSIASLFFKGAEDKQKVINIAQGISQTADVVQQAKDGGMI